MLSLYSFYFFISAGVPMFFFYLIIKVKKDQTWNVYLFNLSSSFTLVKIKKENTIYDIIYSECYEFNVICEHMNTILQCYLYISLPLNVISSNDIVFIYIKHNRDRVKMKSLYRTTVLRSLHIIVLKLRSALKNNTQFLFEYEIEVFF
jgi:hypothetical protein